MALGSRINFHRITKSFTAFGSASAARISDHVFENLRYVLL
jgi:hypothetical protein